MVTGVRECSAKTLLCGHGGSSDARHKPGSCHGKPLFRQHVACKDQFTAWFSPVRQAPFGLGGPSTVYVLLCRFPDFPSVHQYSSTPECCTKLQLGLMCRRATANIGPASPGGSPGLGLDECLGSLGREYKCSVEPTRRHEELQAETTNSEAMQTRRQASMQGQREEESTGFEKGSTGKRKASTRPSSPLNDREWQKIVHFATGARREYLFRT